jgi:hypothetical protein
MTTGRMSKKSKKDFVLTPARRALMEKMLVDAKPIEADPRRAL